jgi:hypothetical protein
VTEDDNIPRSVWAEGLEGVPSVDLFAATPGVGAAAPSPKLWESASLTEAVEKGGAAFLRAMARREDADRLAEILRDEDPTGASTWEALAFFWFARGRPEAARRALFTSAAYAAAPEAGWTRAAQLAEGAGETALACQAWRRAASLAPSPWNPRWARFLRCLEKAPMLGDRGAWVSFLAERVPESERPAYARWLEGDGEAPSPGP